jgi:hypothetical protein
MVYRLPAATEHSVLDVAGRSQLLLFGELHGTCEVPGVIAGLLPKLELLGYRGLALEVPFDVRDHLADWASGRAAQPPAFYSRPSKDGRGNQQALDLAATAAASGFELLCFDQGHGQITHNWADRDEWMATNLLEQWRRLCVGGRVVAICGSLHARLRPDQGIGRWLRKAASGGQTPWPSLAAWVREREPTLAVATIDVRFAAGAYFNMGQRTIYARPNSPAEAWVEPGTRACTLELWLPRASPATFSATPA